LSTMAYIKNIMKDKHIASITPTSSFGVKKVCSKIDFKKRNVIIEYGPATGVFSKYLLNHLTDDSMLVLVERNANFASVLKKQFNDHRVFIHHDNAQNVENIIKGHFITEVDYVISGIPFSFLSKEIRSNIVQHTCRVLKKDGKFLPYQTFFQKDEHLKDHMDQYFSRVHDEYFFLNAPPMRVYEAIK
jgi:phosphatidylethanolamine/phosphatidyl-N-methylethanolamine N-methyltransferase